MIKISVMYPNSAGEKFDHAYYRDKHMPLVKDQLGAACLRYTVDRGLAGSSPDTPETYVAMCHVFSDSVEAFQAGMARGGQQIMADISNFTSIAPVIQISEVVVQ